MFSARIEGGSLGRAASQLILLIMSGSYTANEQPLPDRRRAEEFLLFPHFVLAGIDTGIYGGERNKPGQDFALELHLHILCRRLLTGYSCQHNVKGLLFGNVEIAVCKRSPAVRESAP